MNEDAPQIEPSEISLDTVAEEPRTTVAALEPNLDEPSEASEHNPSALAAVHPPLASADDTMEDEDVRKISRIHTRRSFGVAAVATAAGYGVYRWIDQSSVIGRLQRPLRSSLEFNRHVARALFDERGLSPEFPLSRSVALRLNGTVGLEKELDLSSWRLQLAGVADASHRPRYVNDLTSFEYRYMGEMKSDSQAQDVKSAPGNGPQSKTGSSGAPKKQQPKDTSDEKIDSERMSIADRFDAMNRQINHKRVRGDAEAGPSVSGLDDGTPGLLLTMEDLKQLPKVELVTQFKCIEGWSEIVHWAGFRLRDLLEAYPPEKVNGRNPRFIYMETPDGNYYGGYDMAAARHPQSLLVTEMAGKPLTQEHGAPVRLHMPIKYGYKQLKRIGLIAYMDQRPDDYWTKLGYDWYAGL